MKQSSFLIVMLSIFLIAGCGTATPSNTSKPGTTATPATNTQPSSNANTNTNDPIEPILDHSPKAMQSHFFDNADSVWIDGDWHFNQTSGPRYISTVYGLPDSPNKPIIVELDMNSTADKDYTNYICPRNIRHLTITNIQAGGTIIDFSSTSGVKGSFDLDHKSWTFQ